MKLSKEQCEIIDTYVKDDNTDIKKLKTYLKNHDEITEERHMTQAEVAEAIGTSVRTYQKWENGDTTPDGHNLLRIMNWLDIRDVQDLIEFDDLEG